LQTPFEIQWSDSIANQPVEISNPTAGGMQHYRPGHALAGETTPKTDSDAACSLMGYSLIFQQVAAQVWVVVESV